jgi:hypothetical protein
MRTLLAASLLALLAAWPAAAEAPRVQVGTYSMGVEKVARVRDLERPPASQNRTALVIFVEAQGAEELKRVVEVCRDPAAVDNTNTRLAFLQVTPASPSAQGRKSRRYLEVVFSGTRLGATQLKQFEGTLVCFASSRACQWQVSAQPGETDESAGATLLLDSLGPGQDDAGNDCLLVRLQLEFGPGSGPASAQEWRGGRLTLVDGVGNPLAPLSTALQYRYDAAKRLVAINLTGYFELNEQSRDAALVRYEAERLSGLKALPYRFTNLPLP